MMLRLLLIRHGETDSNASGRFQGQSNAPLNLNGQKQAATLSQAIAGEAVQALYASDLRRARETAQAIATPLGLSIKHAPELRKLSFGTWEGLTYTDIEQRDPQALVAWQRDPNDVAPPGGETLRQLAARVGDIYGEIVSTHMGNTVVLVSHGGPLRVLICLALGLSPSAHWQFTIAPGAISELYIDTQNAILST